MSFDPAQFVYLTKTGHDPYIAAMAQGAGSNTTLMHEFVYDDSCHALVFRGILKYKLMQRCLRDGRSFFYVDSGYMGNSAGANNVLGHKVWHRVCHNAMQHPDVTSRPDDRFRRLGLSLPQRRRSGRSIMIVPPSEKSARYYNIDTGTWIQDVLHQCANRSDRPVIVREKNANRQERRFHEAVQDCHVVVTFNSNAATESILMGVPAIVLCPDHAAWSVSSHDLAALEKAYWPDQDQIYRWVCHLAYCQFTVSEMKQGTIWRILNAD